MTIQTINIGTTPNDDTGDDPRTAGQKLNSNFTTITHAASRDVGTASGNIPDADDLNITPGAANYTSNNFNRDKFGGVGAGITLATGFARTATELRLYMPIDFVNNATSITITGTFSIFTPSYVLIASGINGASFSLSDASNKLAGVEITTAGLTINAPYVVRPDTASASITVNG